MNSLIWILCWIMWFWCGMQQVMPIIHTHALHIKHTHNPIFNNCNWRLVQLAVSLLSVVLLGPRLPNSDPCPNFQTFCHRLCLLNVQTQTVEVNKRVMRIKCFIRSHQHSIYLYIIHILFYILITHILNLP